MVGHRLASVQFDDLLLSAVVALTVVHGPSRCGQSSMQSSENRQVWLSSLDRQFYVSSVLQMVGGNSHRPHW
jgi:hypothetical protein